ncbi:hypothetical protein ACOMHN_064389 [Nucella lapillus]
MQQTVVNTSLGSLKIADMCPGVEYIISQNNTEDTILEVDAPVCGKVPAFTRHKGVVYWVCHQESTVYCHVHIEVPKDIGTKMYFSALSENDVPQKLLNGLFNCSGRGYSKFQPHVECNHKTECQDGEDETDHCPFSGPGCRGSVSSGDQCLQLLVTEAKKPVGLFAADCHRMGGRLAALNTCVLRSQRCNEHSDCVDDSDEVNCSVRYTVRVHAGPTDRKQQLFIYLDGAGYFVQQLMTPSQPCPESHYRCMGEGLYCLPVYTRCNSFADCLSGEDELDCDSVTCPGFYRCLDFRICVHRQDMCDGWGQCPKQDDELMCDLTCPKSCWCQGLSRLGLDGQSGLCRLALFDRYTCNRWFTVTVAVNFLLCVMIATAQITINRKTPKYRTAMDPGRKGLMEISMLWNVWKFVEKSDGDQHVVECVEACGEV